MVRDINRLHCISIYFQIIYEKFIFYICIIFFFRDIIFYLDIGSGAWDIFIYEFVIEFFSGGIEWDFILF